MQTNPVRILSVILDQGGHGHRWQRGGSRIAGSYHLPRLRPWTPSSRLPTPSEVLTALHLEPLLSFSTGLGLAFLTSILSWARTSGPCRPEEGRILTPELEPPGRHSPCPLTQASVYLIGLPRDHAGSPHLSPPASSHTRLLALHDSATSLALFIINF